MTHKQDKKNEAPEEERSFFGIIVHSFFIIPFLIAVFCVLLFAAIHLLTRENRSVYDYLEDVKTGGLTKRWQGAFELSKILGNPKLIPDDPRFINEITTAFENSTHDDPRVRQYLALAMGRTGKKEFVPVLKNSLSQEKEENLTAILYALGMLKDPSTIDAIAEFTASRNPKIRSIAVTALGTIADKKSIPVLTQVLNDSEPNVQWGAAVSLAQMGDLSGKEILLGLLSRDYLAKFPEVDPNEQNQMMLLTLDTLQSTSDAEILETIKLLSQSDSNMKVRSKALEIINRKKS